MGSGNGDAGGSVPSEDTGLDSEEQLSTVLGESEVLRDWGRYGEAVSVAERSGAASVCGATDEQGDPGDGRARVYRGGRQCVRWLARKGAWVGDVGADVYKRNGDGSQDGVGGMGERGGREG